VNGTHFVGTHAPILLGQYRAMGREFQRPRIDTDGVLMMGVYFAAAALAVFVVHCIYRWRERWKKRSPVALFNEICAYHKLAKSVQKRLLRLANANGFSHPALLFLTPDVWERPSMRRGLGSDYQPLKDKLFEDETTADAASCDVLRRL
jgi:hypothetical protein